MINNVLNGGRRQMKKKTNGFVALLLAAMMVVSISGCTTDKTDQTNGAEETTVATSGSEETPAETKGDKETTTTAATTDVPGVTDGLPVPSLEGYTIGVAVLGTDHDFDLKAYQGQIDRIEELGGTYIAVDGQRDDQKHISDIENLIIQEPSAIIKQLGDATVYEPVMKKISEAGIPLFTVDLVSQYSICNSTSDNYAIGATLARNMFEDLGGEGKIAVFNGFYGVRVCAIRYDMMKYVAQDYPGIQFIDPELQDVVTGAAEDARKKTLDLLTKEPDVAAIWTAWDTPCIGIAQALVEAGRTDVKIYSVDGDPTVLELVKDTDSGMYGDMAQNPYKIGQAAVDEVARYLAGQEVPSTVYTDPVYVNKLNYEEAIKELGIE